MTNPEKESLRHAVLECLVTRHPAALPPAGIRRRVETEVDFPVLEADVVAALDLLKGLELVACEADEFGASQWWKATAAGVLKVERGR